MASIDQRNAKWAPNHSASCRPTREHARAPRRESVNAVVQVSTAYYLALVNSLGSLRRSVDELELRLSRLENADGVTSHGVFDEVLNFDKAIAEDVVEFTKEIFDGPANVEVAWDAEFGDNSLVVSVECRGSAEELSKKSDYWHRHIDSAAKELTHLYSLSLIPIDESN